MAIDLFCYSRRAAMDVEKVLSSLKAQHSSLFDYKFRISAARPTDAVSREIVSEHGMHDALSLFLVRLNDKAAAGMMGQVEDVLKAEFGQDLLILFENETRR